MEDEALARTVGANIRALREAAGWTQKRLSEACDIPVPHLSRLEKGEHLATLKTVNKVAKAFGVEPDVLLKPPAQQKAPKKRKK